MKTNKIVKIFMKKIGVFKITSDIQSLSSFACTYCRLNCIADLQDCLEDGKVNLDKFCKMSNGFFEMKRGRLRVATHCEENIHFSHIQEILENI
jgi:hypothetical protein